MHRQDPILPSGVQRFLRTFLRDDLLDEVTGDMHEMYKDTLRTKPKLARFLIWYQVFQYLRPFAFRKRSRNNINPIPMYKSYFVAAVRNMIKNKMHALLNILGLSVGVTVTIVITLWITDEISHEKNFPNYSRIGRVIQNVTNSGEVATWGNVPWPLSEELRKYYNTDFEYIGMTTGIYSLPIQVDSLKFDKRGMWAETDLAKMLSLKMIYGTVDAVNDPSFVLISKSTATSFFGDADPVGKTMVFDGNTSLNVGGVYEDIPANSEFTDLHYFGPWDVFRKFAGLDNMEDPWRPNGFELYVMLNEQATFEGASERIKDAKLKKQSEELKKMKPELFLHPMKDWHLRSEFVNGKHAGGRIQYVWLFGIVGVFVLFMACINFMNLSTARSEKRAKEVGIRKAIGSLRSQLVTQFLSESVITVFISLLVALLLVQLSLPFFNIISQKHMSMPWGNLTLWVSCFVFTIVIGVIAGSYPAVYLSGLGAQKASAGRSSSWLRRILVTLQFTVSVVLIIGTSVVYLQIQHAKNRPLGYSSNGLVSIPITKPLFEHLDAARTQLQGDGAVVELAHATVSVTQQYGSSSRFDWQGKDPNLSIDFPFYPVSVDYGKTIKWNLTMGRDFERGRLADSSAMILNKAAADYMAFPNPVGETIRWGGQPYEVIGVIDNMVMTSPYAPPRPTIYVMSNDDPDGVLLARLNPEVPASESIAKIEAVYKQYSPDRDFTYEFTDVAFNRKFGNEERVGTLATTLAGLAIFISCLGVFGLSSFTAEQRTKEIGVRKVLGASIFDLWQMMSKDFVVLVTISCVVAVPIAYLLLNDWLQSFAYHIGVPLWTFFAATGSTLVITLVTISWHTLSAAGANPVKSLRVE